MTARPGSYVLAIDLGTTTVTAALGRAGVATAVPLDPRHTWMSTEVRSSPAGAVVVDEPDDAPTSLLDLSDLDPTASPGANGTAPTTAERVRALIDEVLARVVAREGGPPGELVLTHPATCPYSALAHLVRIARGACAASVRLVPAPVAALRGHRDRLPDGAHAVVVRLDDRGVEAAVLRADRAGPELAGPASTFSPERRPSVTPAGTSSSTEAVHRALRDAGTELGAVEDVLLVGRWSREPGLASLFSELLGRAVSVDPDPEMTVVLGAAAAVGSDAVRAPVAGDAFEASEPPAAPPELDDDVQVTVYRPTRIRPERWYTLLAFVHRSEPTIDADTGRSLDPLAMVRKQADGLLADEEGVFGAVVADTAMPLARGSTLVVEPWLDGGVVNPPRAWLAWEEPVHRLPFRLRVPAEHDGRKLAGGLRVYLGVVLVSDVTFTLSVSASAALADSAEPVSARFYREIFASYSRRDVAVVRAVADYVAVTGDRYVIDSQTLRSGERWEPRLDELIERADVFQLFWSRHAMRSPQVRREWEFALRLGREGFIRPVYWEEPRPADPAQRLPPPEIGALHWARIPTAPPSGDPVGSPPARAGTPPPLATASMSPEPVAGAPPTARIPSPRPPAEPRSPMPPPFGPLGPSGTPPPEPARDPRRRTRWTLVGGAVTAAAAVIGLAVGVGSAIGPSPASPPTVAAAPTSAPPDEPGSPPDGASPTGVATLAVAFPEIEDPGSPCRPVAVGPDQTATAAVECPHAEVAPDAKVVYFAWDSVADTQRWQASQIRQGKSLEGTDRWTVGGVPQGTVHARSTAPGVATSAVYDDVPYGFLITTGTLAESAELLSALPLRPSSQIPG
ncbi:TIR domain-containing protein [Actinomycetospora flava]|uniref:TIR domain-containing protein n=1 Tax=Actinomycetospora flava TaxID=3129232 RepID=A0ABU8M3D3_9PSEU